jgi:hypothetical protein
MRGCDGREGYGEVVDAKGAAPVGEIVQSIWASSLGDCSSGVTPVPFEHAAPHAAAHGSKRRTVATPHPPVQERSHSRREPLRGSRSVALSRA